MSLTFAVCGKRESLYSIVFNARLSLSRTRYRNLQRRFTSVLDLDKGYFDKIYGTFLPCLSKIKLPQFLVGFEVKTLPFEQTFPSCMAFTERLRLKSFAWLVCRVVSLFTSNYATDKPRERLRKR